MKRYPERRLGDVLELRVRTVELQDSDIYPIAGVYSFGRGVLRRDSLLGSQTKYSRLYRIRTGDLVLSRLKAFEGAVAVVPEDFEGYCVSQEFPTFTVDINECLPSYLAYLCEYPDFWGRLSVSSKGMGSRRERVGAQELLNTRVPLPDVDEQQRIVVKLKPALTQLPYASGRARALGVGLTNSLFNFAFEHESGAAAGEILEQVKRPSEVVVGKSFRVAGVYSFGRGMFRRGLIDASETKYSTLFGLREGDLVLSRLKAFEGAIAVADRSMDGAFVSQEFPTFHVDQSGCSLRYLHYLCSWPSFWSRLSSGSKGVGSRRERVSAEVLLATKIPLPSLARQEQIVSVLDDGVGRLGTLTVRRQRLLDALRPALLNAAFSGQL